jgi:hypothetical protein
VPPGVELFATSRNSAPEFNRLNWANIARDFDHWLPDNLPDPVRRAPFIEKAPFNHPIEAGIPMSRMSRTHPYNVTTRVSRKGDLVIGIKPTASNVSKVDKAFNASKDDDFFYDKFNMTKEHAKRWLENAKKTILNRRKGGANKSRKSGTRKTRKSGKSRKARKARH